MRNTTLALLVLLISFMPNRTYAQSKGDVAAAAAGAIVAIGTGITAIEQMKERAELTATQWLLSNNQEIKNFSLKTLDFNGRKLKDMSSVSVITYKIQEFTPKSKPVLDGKKYVLLAFTSQGWINRNGLDFSKIKWFMIDSHEWINMMTSYAKVASGITKNIFIQDQLKKGKIVNKGIKVKGKLTVPFYKLEEDMYVSTDYSDDMKFVYNERSLGIFLKQTKDLVQISRKGIIEIHDFFLDINHDKSLEIYN